MENSEVIEYLSKINIFVGENNSGKSLFLRNLVSNKINYLPQSEFVDVLNSVISSLKDDINSYLANKGIENLREIKPILDEIEIVHFIDDNFILGEKLKTLEERILNLKNMTGTQTNFIYHSKIGIELEPIFNNSLEPLSEFVDINSNFEEKLKKPNFKKVYIPILRGIRPINSIDNALSFDNKDVFKMRTMKDYFQHNEDDFEVFTGLDIYNKVKSHLLGNLHQRKLIKEYEQYLSKNFFDSKEIALIPKEESDVLSIKIGDEMERPIYELGDGLQSIIILTMPLFLNKDEYVLFFFEEPEQYLHPGLQRKLLEILVDDNFKTYQYFMTTHSNHFLDITLDYSEISIFGFKKQFNNVGSGNEQIPTFLIENLSHGDQSLLELLGVKNSSVFLSNCTIWVEGITDRLYLKRYFDLYLQKLEKSNADSFKPLREDYHYSYVEYAGNNIEHWSFLDDESSDNINVNRLCAKLFLIADKDEGKDERHRKLKDTLKENFYLLNCKEVENLISKKVLLQVINYYENYFKNETPVIQEFNEEDYQNEYLGAFIESKLSNQERASYRAESGTVKDKMAFCKKALSYTNEFDDLSEEAKTLCNKLHDFIMSNNS
jgi:predicted ATP-dependent endonuclease of OLD family